MFNILKAVFSREDRRTKRHREHSSSIIYRKYDGAGIKVNKVKFYSSPEFIMKRTGNLKYQWCNYDRLLEAFYEVKSHKSYHHNFLRFESDVVGNLNRILTQLETGTYEVKKPRSFYVYEPKKRLIEAPDLEDRIVQHALLIVVRNLIERRFIGTTFACIKGRGTHKASDTLVRYLQSFKGGGYCLKMDIEKFFYSIDHDILKEKISRIIKCQATLNLLFKFFDTHSDIGLPLGSVTSQVFANLMLNELDHFIKRERGHKYYLRYMDDFLILDSNKDKLAKTLILCQEKISVLKLRLNNKTAIGKIENGIDFVGYKTFLNRRVIRKRSLYKIKRTLLKDANLNRIASYLSHSKRTASIKYVAGKIIETAPKFRSFVNIWIYKNLGIKFYEKLNNDVPPADYDVSAGAFIYYSCKCKQ